MTSGRAFLSSLAAIAATVALAGPAAAAVTDPVGDFLATYLGPQNPDLDLIGVDAVYLGANVSLSTTVNGPIGTTAGAFYPFVINRGAGTEGGFAAMSPQIGAGMLHDAVVLLRPNLSGAVVLINPDFSLTMTPLPGGLISVAGDTITGLIPLSMLPSRGFSPDDYTYAALGRSGLGNTFVSDFGESAPFTATVPEPQAWALMILGFGLAGAMLRYRRRLAPA